MANSLDDQLSAFGVAQVIVVLKNAPPPTSGAKVSTKLAAAVPVTASRSLSGANEALIMRLTKHFKVGEFSLDTALAAADKGLAKTKKLVQSAGANWYRRAKSAKDPTPPARYFPNLGLLLGTVDKAGLSALKSEGQVAKIVAPPQISLIRPVSAAHTTPKKEITWGIRQLKADKLHTQGLTGLGVIVGHLDTGADGKHPALKTAFHGFAEFDMLGFEISPSPSAHDTDEHGTHTAGTIVGRTVGGRAIGVAPQAKLASAIVIEGGNVIARILAGMDWSIGQGARILNMSLGIRGFTEDFLSLTQILRNRGVLPVFAVGNEGAGTSRSPGNYAEALSIGAMGQDKRVPGFSSSREFARPTDPFVPDLVAPGVGIISAMPGGGYQEMDGTSMATPHISGLAALLMQAKPEATIDQIEKVILDSCATLAHVMRQRQNRGVPDAVKALALLNAIS